MGAMEIVLLLAGGIVFVLSFFLPAGADANTEENKTLAREEIKNLVGEEMNAIRGHVDDVVDETVGYAMEKTERSLERLSNEKIMAVSQYSDTVLEEINKNHKEVMFLYDMLNDKHANLKDTVSEAAKTAKAVAETKKEAEEVVNSFQRLAPETTENVNTAEPVKTSKAKSEPVKEAAKEKEAPVKEAFKQTESPGEMDISFTAEEGGESHNCNDRILELYKAGKSKVVIAKELGLGVGEVKLVIDLYKNR